MLDKILSCLFADVRSIGWNLLDFDVSCDNARLMGLKEKVTEVATMPQWLGNYVVMLRLAWY